MNNKKIDELMAEVRGWTRIDAFSQLKHKDNYTYEHPKSAMWVDENGKEIIEIYKFLPTTLTNQAMECADELGWQIGIYKTQKGLWGVHLESPCDTIDIIEKDKSAPLAICKAILKAKGIEG